MKTKYILKTVGLVTAFSLSSFSLISCDGSSDSTNNGIDIDNNDPAPSSLNGKIIRFFDPSEPSDFAILSFSEDTVTDGYDTVTYQLSKLDSNLLQVTFNNVNNPDFDVFRFRFNTKTSGIALEPQDNGEFEDDGDFTISDSAGQNIISIRGSSLFSSGDTTVTVTPL